MTKRGRPILAAGERRDAVVPVRLNRAEHQLCEEAAAAAGESLSTWIRTKAVSSAKRAHAHDDAPDESSPATPR